MVSRVAQSSWEHNDAVKGMICDLGALLSSQGRKEKEAWAELHKTLAKILCSLSVALNPNTTTKHILRELKQMLTQIDLGHVESEEIFRQIIVAFQKRIREENPDASEAISLLKNLILLVADQLEMLPVRDSNHVSMIKEGYTFCQDKVDHMINASKELSDPNAPYAVISIVGPQSCGKSYLLNRLFGTEFPEMNPNKGWSRTTQGIMISRCINPSLLILDVEGFDGVERQKKDVSFENKAALFTLAISDVMMVNINETDINREEGGGAKLFRAIFQERVKLPQGLTQIIIVVRRYGGEIPLDILERQVRERMEQLWETGNNHRENAEFRDYIEVKVIALPGDKESDKFQEKVKELRKLLSKSTIELSPKVPASSFSHSSKLLWEEIRHNRRLDIPSHKVIVATMFCNEKADEAIDSLYSHKEYDVLKGQESPEGFKETSDTLLDSIMAIYDQETKMYDNDVREKERKRLLREIKTALAVYAKKLIIMMREKISQQFRHEFAMQLDSMEKNVEPSHYDSWIETCGIEFTKLCEDLKEFDTDFFHDKCKDLQSELHIYIRSKLLKLTEERARKEIELAQQRNDKNVQDLIQKLEVTTSDRQHMDEEIKRQQDKQEQESRKATEDLGREHQKAIAMKDKEIERLRSELEEKNARPTFSLSNVFSTMWDYFTK